MIRTARLYTKGGFYELSAKVFVDASADADVASECRRDERLTAARRTISPSR